MTVIIAFKTPNKALGKSYNGETTSIIIFFLISSNFTYNKACVLPVTKDEMGQLNEQV